MPVHYSHDMPDANPKRKRFGALFVIPFRPKASGPRAALVDSRDSGADVERNGQDSFPHTKVGKSSTPKKTIVIVKPYKQDDLNGGHNVHVRQENLPAVEVSQAWERDKQTGEIVDHTEMLHSLVDQDPLGPLGEQAWLAAAQGSSQSGEGIVSQLSPSIWRQVLDYIGPADAANLAFSCKAFRDLLGPDSWNALNYPDNHHHKITFLLHMDRYLPNHLFCFSCATYHIRIQRGQESLKPTNIRNPLFNCPNLSSPKPNVFRTRLTFGRSLPFSFVQLALRAHHYSPDHGIPIESLNRRYKDRDGAWQHQTRFAIISGHLLMRVVSTTFAPPGLPPAGERHLLYSREDFVPYFSVCAHWRDGVLMPSVKCALRHIPKPLTASGLQRVGQEVNKRIHRPENPIVTLCHECRPMRRCPECPTEYLIELKMMEDKSDPINLFKQALVLTRWSDLGDGSSPSSPEWAACNGEAEFDSFSAIGRRAISGVFEAHFNGDLIPGQRILSMNPNRENRGEAGHNWY